MSLREKLFGKRGDLRNRLAGVAVAGAGVVSRSTALTSTGAEMIAGKPKEDEIIEPEIKYETDPNVERDEFGNAIIPEHVPNTAIGRFARKAQNKLDEVFDKKTEEPVETNILNEPKEVQIITTKELRDKQLPGVKSEDKKPIIEGAEEIGVEPNVIAKILRGEGLNSSPEHLEEAIKREGAIGPGQHRDIFYKEWNPKFKAKYGRDYDRKNLKDVALVTSMFIKEKTNEYGSLEAALIAYNKGDKVVQDYINDPNVSFDDDPYVKGFKNR